MKRWVLLTLLVAFGVSVIVLAEKHRAGGEVGPQSMLNFLADTFGELARVPAAAVPLSDQKEISLGDRLASNYEAQKPWSIGRYGENRHVEAYIQTVGLRVAGRAERHLPYRFHYIADASFINAFSLPGGHVFIGAGLIRLMDTEDELANILGHEVEHIDRRHCAERVQLEMRLRKLPMGELIALPVELFEAGYTKAQELEADRRGTALAVWAGYSPLGAVRLFERFAILEGELASPAKTPREELSQVARQSLEGYFRAHPPAAERIDLIRMMIADHHWENLTQEKPIGLVDASRAEK